MLESMRKHAKYYYIFFVLIIITFIFWGVGPVDQQQSAFVAEIGSQRISTSEYWDAYKRMGEAYRQLYKDQPFEEIEKKLNLKQLVLDTLVEERVLLQSAADLNLSVSDTELQQAIVNNPAFRRDGVFKREVYLRTLELNRMSPELYESLLRNQIAVAKMRRMIASSAGLTPADVKTLPADAGQAEPMKQFLLYAKQDAAVKSYVEGAKARYKVTVNKEALM